MHLGCILGERSNEHRTLDTSSTPLIVLPFRRRNQIGDVVGSIGQNGTSKCNSATRTIHEVHWCLRSAWCVGTSSARSNQDSSRTHSLGRSWISNHHDWSGGDYDHGAGSRDGNFTPDHGNTLRSRRLWSTRLAVICFFALSLCVL